MWTFRNCDKYEGDFFANAAIFNIHQDAIRM